MSPVNAARLEIIAAAGRDATDDVTYRAEAINPRRTDALYVLWYSRCWMIALSAVEERQSGVNPWPVKGEAA